MSVAPEPGSVGGPSTTVCGADTCSLRAHRDPCRRAAHRACGL